MFKILICLNFSGRFDFFFFFFFLSVANSVFNNNDNNFFFFLKKLYLGIQKIKVRKDPRKCRKYRNCWK